MKSPQFARAEWRTRDQTTVTPAKLDPLWYKKSEETQRREIEKICGTYRAGRSPSARGGTEGHVIASRGTLKDKHHESETVRRLGITADAILIKAGDKASPKPPECPVLTLPAIHGFCRHCGDPIPRHMRADSKFCSGAHRTAFFRREAQFNDARQAFKDYHRAGPELPFYCAPPAPIPTLPMTASYAIRANRVAEHLMARRMLL
jgi:hypothetical protein